MMNGQAVSDALGRSPLVSEMATFKGNAQQIITRLYLSALSRYPTSEEISIASKYATPRREWIEDLEWALINTREFVFLK